MNIKKKKKSLLGRYAQRNQILLKKNQKKRKGTVLAEILDYQNQIICSTVWIKSNNKQILSKTASKTK
jgi:hypothetical protein